jgi:hypothetical protein
MPSRALIDLTDDELRTALRAQAEHVIYSYTDLLHELDRRAARRAAQMALLLAGVAVVLSVIALVIGLVAIRA